VEALSAVGFVLDYLEGRPCSHEDLYDAAQKQFGFTRWDVAGLRHLVLRKTVEGAYCVYRCPNLVAICGPNAPSSPLDDGSDRARGLTVGPSFFANPNED
jgi:hypothetical protein